MPARWPMAVAGPVPGSPVPAGPDKPAPQVSAAGQGQGKTPVRWPMADVEPAPGKPEAVQADKAAAQASGRRAELRARFDKPVEAAPRAWLKTPAPDPGNSAAMLPAQPAERRASAERPPVEHRLRGAPAGHRRPAEPVPQN